MCLALHPVFFHWTVLPGDLATQVTWRPVGSSGRRGWAIIISGFWVLKPRCLQKWADSPAGLFKTVFQDPNQRWPSLPSPVQPTVSCLSFPGGWYYCSRFAREESKELRNQVAHPKGELVNDEVWDLNPEQSGFRILPVGDVTLLGSGPTSSRTRWSPERGGDLVKDTELCTISSWSGSTPWSLLGTWRSPTCPWGLPYRTSLLCTPRLQVLGGPSAHLSGLMSVSQKFATKQLSRVTARMDRGRQEGEGGRSHSPTAAELGCIPGPRTGSLGLCPDPSLPTSSTLPTWQCLCTSPPKLPSGFLQDDRFSPSLSPHPCVRRPHFQ